MRKHAFKLIAGLLVGALVAFAVWICSPRGSQKELALDLGNGVTMKLVLVPAGQFTMGSPKEEVGRQRDESLHEVTISRAKKGSGTFFAGMDHPPPGGNCEKGT